MRVARIEAAARALVPPILPKALQRLRSAVRRTPDGSLRLDFRPEWEVVRDGWRREDTRSEGWLDPSIVETQRRRWPVYSELIRGKGPLGFPLVTTGVIPTADESAHNVYMSFAYVLARAALGQDRLSVLDWGGGIGYYALIAERLLPEVRLDYVVKDLPGFARLGREVIPAVSFQTDEAACFSRAYDLVLASSSIQYGADWRTLVKRLADASSRWLYLSRVPVTQRAESFVVVQRPYHYGYRTEYLSWVFNKDELLGEIAAAGLTLEREFLAGGIARIRHAPDTIELLGFLCRREEQRLGCDDTADQGGNS